ncbi:4-alpha-glucanotransferase (amylomaltase) [hydrothermal vent metagenome]|uniref:4-alpha-glucanotransferase n=1 Tax=hydrothermal vent metagenome TaxID=652676 RepID=A0A3B1AFS0_9ZZZZ
MPKLNNTTVSTLNKTEPLAILNTRRCGILCHPSSLPGPLFSGDFSHQSYRFIEFLRASKISVWQMLPLGPVHDDHSPYQCKSVHAGNPYLISLDWLVDKNLLDTILEPSIKKFSTLSESNQFRIKKLYQAYDNFLKLQDRTITLEFNTFSNKNKFWLDDYCLYHSIRQLHHDTPWYQWPTDLRDREKTALKKIEIKLQYQVFREKFIQFVFFKQWNEIKQYANNNNVHIFGDIPLFVAHDSADVWAHPEYFSVSANGSLKTVTGVPPDYFSKTGQRWGNPQYKWKKLLAENFSWWHERIATQLELFDIIRIDHFRGLESYWEISADTETAIDGHWVPAPGKQFLNSVKQHFGTLPLVAEDLGTITNEVTQLRRCFSIPGMKILQFAFDGNSDNSYLPHHHEKQSVVYTGTHDNDTTLSWYQQLSDNIKATMNNYYGFDIAATMPWPLIRSALASRSNLAILPMQDVLALGQGNRMNLPGTTKNNWLWRFSWDDAPNDLADILSDLVALYDRAH